MHVRVSTPVVTWTLTHCGQTNVFELTDTKAIHNADFAAVSMYFVCLIIAKGSAILGN